MKEKYLPLAPMKSCCSNPACISKSFNTNSEWSMPMLIKSLKTPFQYTKIYLNKKKGLEQQRAKNMAGTLKLIWSYLAREKGQPSLVLVMVFATSALSLLGP